MPQRRSDPATLATKHMRHITNEEILGAVSLADAEQVLRHAYLAMGREEAKSHPRLRSHAAGGRLSTLGGILPQAGFLGSKTYATCNGRTGFAIVLFSAKDATPVACLQGEAVTQLKGSVTTALVADVLARPDAVRLAVFGTGTQARAHIAALRRVRDIKAVSVVSRSPADDYIRWVESEYGIPVTQCDGNAAVDGADIVVLATRSSTPLFDGSRVRKGTFIAALGSSTLQAREVDKAFVRRADLIGVEWKAQAQVEAGDLSDGVDWNSILELGDILTSPALTSGARDEVRFFKSVGLGIADIAVAVAAFARLTGGWEQLAASMAQAPSTMMRCEGKLR